MAIGAQSLASGPIRTSKHRTGGRGMARSKIHLRGGIRFLEPIAWWYREPPKAVAETTKPGEKKKEFVAGATMVASGGPNGPIPIMTGDMDFSGKESFVDKEVKFARRWLTTKGVMVQEEQRNPVDVELESFFDCCRTGQTPKANLEVAWRIRSL
jgi:hypothetical protein